MSTPQAHPQHTKASHLRRVLTIATHTFTQLVRMKVFYFLAFFAIIVIASNMLDLPQHSGPESSGTHILNNIKDWSFGPMHFFSVVMAVVATALLIPRDIEDRTLYTILAKPVPRFDYLLGKLLGVLLLIFTGLLLMDILMVGILHWRTGVVVENVIAYAKYRDFPADAVESLIRETRAQGPTWSLQGAVVAVFLRSAIIASIALLISTFSSSTLFTTIISFLVYFIANFQADARDAYMHMGEAGQSLLQRIGSLLVTLILPDLQIFNVIDNVIQGISMTAANLGQLALVTLYYTTFYLFASWFTFSDKEF